MYTAWPSLSVVSPASSYLSSHGVRRGRRSGVGGGGDVDRASARDSGTHLRRVEVLSIAPWRMFLPHLLSAVPACRRGMTSGPRVPPSRGFGMTRAVAWRPATLSIAGGRRGEPRRQGRRQDRRQDGARQPSRRNAVRLDLQRGARGTAGARSTTILVSALVSPPLNLLPSGRGGESAAGLPGVTNYKLCCSASAATADKGVSQVPHFPPFQTVKGEFDGRTLRWAWARGGTAFRAEETPTAEKGRISRCSLSIRPWRMSSLVVSSYAGGCRGDGGPDPPSWRNHVVPRVPSGTPRSRADLEAGDAAALAAGGGKARERWGELRR